LELIIKESAGLFSGFREYQKLTIFINPDFMDVRRTFEEMALAVSRDHVVTEDFLLDIEEYFDGVSEDIRSSEVIKFLIALTRNVAAISTRLAGEEADSKLAARVDVKVEEWNDQDGMQTMDGLQSLCADDRALTYVALVYGARS
jgi:hypothetical protein